MSAELSVPAGASFAVGVYVCVSHGSLQPCFNIVLKLRFDGRIGNVEPNCQKQNDGGDDNQDSHENSLCGFHFLHDFLMLEINWNNLLSDLFLNLLQGF